MLTGNWNYSQVTVHVHGQEVLSEETIHPGADPESPCELQNPVHTLPPEASREETIQSPDLRPPEEQSLCHELEFQPLRESGGKPQQKGGIVAGRVWEWGCFPPMKEARWSRVGINHRIQGVETIVARVPPETGPSLRNQPILGCPLGI